MASEITRLKLSIRRLNETIDSNMSSINRGHALFIDAINDPTYPNITVAGMRRRREANIGRAKIVRRMCIELHELQRGLIALEEKQALRDLRNRLCGS